MHGINDVVPRTGNFIQCVNTSALQQKGSIQNQQNNINGDLQRKSRRHFLKMEVSQTFNLGSHEHKLETTSFQSLTSISRPKINADSILFSMKYPKLKAPKSILKEAEISLSYYPELYDTTIKFKFNDMVRKNFMQAQPSYASILKSRGNRSYVILISKEFKVENHVFTIKEIPSDVLIGWLGHELGHVMDYRARSTFNMIVFGIKYLFSNAHIQEVERTADEYAVQHGMGEYIIKTKNFILNHTSLSEKYKQHMRKFYLSPEEILELINRYGETGETPKKEELAPQ